MKKKVSKKIRTKSQSQKNALPDFSLDTDPVRIPEVLPLEKDGGLAEEIDETWSSSPSETSRSQEIVPFDTLSAYLREIRSFPRLSREEEHALALRYFEGKDVPSAYTLVQSTLWLVVKIAREYQKAARNLLDLIQEGNIGLLEAVKNYDPYRGVRFPSYAVWWVRAYIIRYVIANLRMVKIGTTQAQRKLFFNLQKEKEKLEREGFRPEPKLLAEKLDVRESDVIEMQQRLGGSDVSVDAPLLSDSTANLLSVLPDHAENAEESLARRQIEELLGKQFDDFEATLNQKEGIIFEKRLKSEEKATLHDLSEELNISKERVRQIENRIKEKLKTFLEENLGKDELDSLMGEG